MTAVPAICSQYHSPFQYMCCFESIGCAADLARVLPIRKSSCNDSIGGWDTVYVRWPRRRDPKRGEECVYTVLQRRMWHWLRSLGVLRPIIIGKAERRTEQLSRWPRLGSRGNLFFFLSSLVLSLFLSFFFLSQIFLSIMCSETEFSFFCSAGLELWFWVQTVKIKWKPRENVLGRNKTCKTIQKLRCWTKSTASTSQEPTSNWKPEGRELH